MTRIQTFAAAIAAEFRQVGIYRSEPGKMGMPRGESGEVEGPVCFWINSIAGAPPLGFREALNVCGLVGFLDDNDDETVLAALDRLAEGK